MSIVSDPPPPQRHGKSSQPTAGTGTGVVMSLVHPVVILLLLRQSISPTESFSTGGPTTHHRHFPFHPHSVQSAISTFPTTSGPYRHGPSSSLRIDALRPIRRRLPSSTSSSSSSSLLAIRLPLIAANDAWGNFAALTGAAALAQGWGRTTAIGRLLGAPVSAMALTFAMASWGILSPGGTAASRSLQLLSLQLATPLILLGADLRDCGARCGPLLISFLVASLATAIACFVGWHTSGRLLQAALGRDGLIIAAALTAKNIGGGINYVAVCRSLNASPHAVAAGLCVDNLFALLYFPITTALGSGLPDVGPTSGGMGMGMGRTMQTMLDRNDQRDYYDDNSNSPMTVQSLLNAICVSCLLLWFGERIGGPTMALPACTVLTVLFASRAPPRFLRSIRDTSTTIGTACLYLFFSTAGSPGMKVAHSVRSSLWPLTLFLGCLYTIHGLLLWASNRIVFGWKGRTTMTMLDETMTGSWRAAFVPQRLLVASSSAIGGPATSVALAKSHGWTSLEVPSLIVGNIGYAVATFCGLAYYYGLLRR